MAHKPPVCAVICKRYAAAVAFIGVAALTAGDKLVCAPAIQKQDALLAAGDIFFQLGFQNRADVPAVAPAKLPLHIHYLHPRQLHAVISLRQDKIAVCAVFSGIPAGNIRRGGAQQQQRSGLGAEIFCHISGVVTGGVFGLVGILLLLVDYYKTQLLRRSENGAAGADDHSGFAFFDPLPLVIPLTHREAGVEHRYIVSEMRGEGMQHLGRQGDLRHKEYGRAAPPQLILNQTYVYGGLSAAGDAEQQRRPGRFAVPQGRNAFIRRLLAGVQPGKGQKLAGIFSRTAESLSPPQSNQLPVGQRFHGLT